MKLVQGLICCVTLWSMTGPGRAAAEAMLELEATIPLPEVKGRIDHFTIDFKRGRLFVAALGNNTVEIIDLKKNRHERSLTGFGEPQGVLYVPEQDRIYVANGKAGRVDILDASSLAVRKRLEAEDADNLRLDQKGRSVVVGYGKGALRFLDTSTEQASGEIKLPGHPESFQAEQGGPRIFVNVPTANQAQDTDDILIDPARKRVYVICGEGRIDVFSHEGSDRYSLAGSVPTAPGARTGLLVPGGTDRLYVAAPAAGSSPARVLAYRVH